MTAESAANSLPIAVWKSKIKSIITAGLKPNEVINEGELEKQLDKIISSRFKDVPVTLHNNYLHRDTRTTLLQIVACIMNGMCILGGDGCLFFLHSKSLSINVPIIDGLQKGRKEAKKERKKYEDGSDMYIMWDNKQKNIKIIINSLYGALGYPRFIFYNVNLAQSITAMGQAIISTASCGYENFLADNIKFVNISELYEYILNIFKDYEEVKDKYWELLDSIDEVSESQVARRLASKASFQITTQEAKQISAMLMNADKNLLKLLFYKNNIGSFNRTGYMRNLIRSLFDGIDTLTLGDKYAFEDMNGTGSLYSPESPQRFYKLIEAYQVLVQYNHPTYDRVRRTRYTDKKGVLYIDTDSNFLSLDPFVRYILNDVYSDRTFVSEEKASKVMAISMVYTMVLSDVVERNFVKFTESLNIPPEYGKILGMKNEFYYTRMAFTNVKKRYFGWQMLQEGKLVKGGEGKLDIKGFDFIKAGTKATIREKYKKMAISILKTENIPIGELLKEAWDFKEEIRKEILSGNTEYFKQTTVSVLERYKNPYSIQGVKGIILWNAIAGDDDVIDLPAEVDLIPITLEEGYTEKRIQAITSYGARPNVNDTGFRAAGESMPALYKFIREFPDEYERLWNSVLTSDNPDISGIKPNIIAKPRYYSGNPAWLESIINADKIINDSVALITPVLQSTGIKAVNVGTGSGATSHYTNLVQI